MKIISPVYLGQHSYPKYDEMIASLKKNLEENNVLKIDLEFLHGNEVQSYLQDILLPTYTKYKTQVYLQTRSKERMKKVIRTLKENIWTCSPVESEEGFFTIEL